MKNKERSWRLAAVVAAAAVFLAMTYAGSGPAASGQPAAAQTSPQSVTVQWAPKTIVETRLLSKIEADNRVLIEKLAALAASPDAQDPGQWEKAFSTTYLAAPRLWTDEPAQVAGWPDVFKKLKPLVHGSTAVSIDTINIIIDYLPPDEKRPHDLLAHIRITFSLSSGEDPSFEGTLCHRKICTWEPCPSY